MNESLLNLISGLVGSIIGAVSTWLVTRSSLAKEHDHQELMMQKQNAKRSLTALKSVREEVGYNVVHFIQIEKLLNNLGKKIINYKSSGMRAGLSDRSWYNHSDILIDVLTDKQLSEATSFYLNSSLELNSQVFTLDRLEKLISSGLSVSKMLDEVIINYKN